MWDPHSTVHIDQLALELGLNFDNPRSPAKDTDISIVGINVDLENRENYQKIAQIASHGHVRSINPVNTSLDGDTVFVFSTEEVKSFLTPLGEEIAKSDWYKLSVDIIGQAAAKAVQESIYNACYEAETIDLDGAFGGKVPSTKDYL